MDISNDFYVYGDENVQVPAHLNFGKYILNRLRSFNDEVALERADTGEKITYRDFTKHAIDLSIALSKLGIQNGDVVALAMEKCNNFIATALGIILTGAAYTPMDLKIGKSELKHKLHVAKPKYLICTQLFWSTYADILKSLDIIKTYVALEDDVDWGVSVKQLMSHQVDVDSFRPAAVIGQTDTAVILFSSGTTGMPKGVELTHLNCILSCLPTGFSDKSLKVAFMAGEWYHNYNFFMAFKFLSDGKKIVYVDEVTPEVILKCVDDFQINAVFLVPFMLTRMLKTDISNYNTESLQMIYSRSSSLHVKTIEKIKERFPKLKQLFQGYGMTEAGEPTSESCITKGLKIGSVGMASPGIILKVIDPTTGKVLGANQVGEICVSGPVLMKGYIDVERSVYLDEQGFFKTGDLGYYDEDRYFFIVDRLKDIIVYKGIKIAPMELESIILQHPAVLDVGVIGKEAPDFGEVPMAFVVKKPGSNVTEEDLINYVALEVSPYMKLRGGVEFIKIIPRNQRGKILRTRLNEMLKENTKNCV